MFIVIVMIMEIRSMMVVMVMATLVIAMMRMMSGRGVANDQYAGWT